MGCAGFLLNLMYIGSVMTFSFGWESFSASSNSGIGGPTVMPYQYR